MIPLKIRHCIFSTTQNLHRHGWEAVSIWENGLRSGMWRGCRDFSTWWYLGRQVTSQKATWKRPSSIIYTSLLDTSTIALLLDWIRIMWNRKLQQFYISSAILDPGIFSILPLSWHLFWRTRQNSINGRLNKLTNFHLHLLISFIKYFLLVLVTCG